MTPEELTERRKYIGASETETMLGLDKWKSQLELQQEKLSTEIPVDKKTFRLHMGSGCEGAVRDWYTIIHPEYKVHKPTEPTVHPKYSMLRASPDGIVEYDGKRWGLEIKTAGTSTDWGDTRGNGVDDDGESVPRKYFLQCLQSMLCLGYDRWDLAVAIGYGDYREYTILRSAHLDNMRRIEKYAEVWWQDHIVDRLPAHPTVAELALRDSANIEVVATPEISESVRNLKNIKEEIKHLETVAEAFDSQIKLAMQQGDTLVDNGKVLATWKSSKPSNKFYAKLFESENPELYAKYVMPMSGARRFLIK